MNLAVLIFLKTYVCKHESKHERKHIEPKPTQKNCSNEIKLYLKMEFMGSPLGIHMHST